MATSDATNKFYCLLPMSKVFQVWPKRIKRSNGTVLTPDMEVTVTTLQHTTTPFYNGAKELQEVYMRIYAFDYKKACCNPNDFEFRKLDEERWKNMTAEDKLQANVAGVSMVATAISEKAKVDLSPDFILAMNKMEMSAKQISEYIKSFSEKNIDSMDSFTDYLRGELSGDSKKDVFDAIEETESRLHPDYSDGDILVEINSMKDKLSGEEL